jgi:hypothetical protein
LISAARQQSNSTTGNSQPWSYVITSLLDALSDRHLPQAELTDDVRHSFRTHFGI